jgi:hypothetical protein
LLVTAAVAFLQSPWTMGQQEGTNPAASIDGKPAVELVGGTLTEEPYLWGVVGYSAGKADAEFAAGVRAKVIRLSWRSHAPDPTSTDWTYVDRLRGEIDRTRKSGLAVILELGFHDTPAWVHSTMSNSRYINQFGEAYVSNGEIDSGDANLVFNFALRQLVASYVADVFRVFGSDFVAVRAGGGRYGELTYPRRPAVQRDNSYWAFDAIALTRSPTPHWKPGQPSPHGEASKFVNWYLDSLVEFQNWQIAMIRSHYDGPIMVLYPSWGIRPGQIADAVASNLSGTTPAEGHYEIQSGVDFERQIKAIADPKVIVTTTWLDAANSGDASRDSRLWSPTKYLAHLVAKHPMSLAKYGENTGQGNRLAMELAAAQMHTFGLIGMAWYRDEELFSGNYATIDDFQQIIRSYPLRRPA